MYLNDNFKFIMEFFNKTRNNNLASFNRWLESKKDYNIMSIAARDINSRFNQLIKPSNPFCKNNFIDFNFVVDQILQMSIPYNDTKGHNSNHHTELSKFSFQNDFKPNNIQNSGFTNSQNSMFSKFTPSAFLNQPKNLQREQENPLSVIREENQSLYQPQSKKDEKNTTFNDGGDFSNNKNNEMIRNRSI